MSSCLWSQSCVQTSQRERGPPSMFLAVLSLHWLIALFVCFNDNAFIVSMQFYAFFPKNMYVSTSLKPQIALDIPELDKCLSLHLFEYSKKHAGALFKDV